MPDLEKLEAQALATEDGQMLVDPHVILELIKVLKPFAALNVKYEERYHDYPNYAVLADCGTRSVDHGDFREAYRVYEKYAIEPLLR